MTDECLSKLREGLSSHNMLNIVFELDQTLLCITIMQHASPELLQEFLTPPHLNPPSFHDSQKVKTTLSKLFAAHIRYDNILYKYIVLNIIFRILCEITNLLITTAFTDFARKAHNKLLEVNRDLQDYHPELTNWLNQVHILFDHVGIPSGSSVKKVKKVQQTILNYEPSISRLPECIVDAIISSKKTCPCCFGELIIPTTIIMTSCCWDCYCIDCVRKLHEPICPSCRTPFDFHVNMIKK